MGTTLWRNMHRLRLVAALSPIVGRGAWVMCDGAAASSGRESAPSGCPVMHKKAQSAQSATAKSPLSGCPMHKDKKTGSPSEELDPSNMMPAANQEIAPGQQFPLSTERIMSTIPKGDAAVEGEAWSYPSPQMFYNALIRKDKGEGVEEKDVATIVAIHNNMNEISWNELMAYEHLCHPSSAEEVKLLKFIGRPDELTPLATLWSWCGYGLPFDRHDWTIVRDGESVRYVIDYYHDEDAEEDELPGLHSQDKVKSITLHVRPALDSFGAAFDRVKMLVLGALPVVPKEASPEEELQEVADLDWRAGMASTEWKMMTNRITVKCEDRIHQLQQASSDQDRAMASQLLDLCLGGIACKVETQNYLKSMESETEDGAEEVLFDCLGDFKLALKNANAANHR